ncbi:hypothetical protein VRK_35670 [Vibrio sp. MEBiC08052]|nr:hypothetical protein VRK_35670 [Vibrio sp. MEBiC08052]
MATLALVGMLFIPVVLRSVVVQNISAISPPQALEKYDFS